MRALAAAVVVLLAGCTGGSVPLPTPDAAPEQVVATYLRALEVKDCRTATALLAPGKTGSWCGRISVSDVSVGSPLPDPGAPATRMNVPVAFVSRGGDSSLPDGRHTWGYILVRGSDGRWLIIDEGVG